MNLHWLIFVLVSVGFYSITPTASEKTKKECRADLFKHLSLDSNDSQNARMWPLIFNKDNSTEDSSTYIYVDIFVTSIINVNEKAQSLTTQVKIMTAWPNTNLTWNNETFCGIDTFVAPKNMFWTPDIGIVESIKTEFGTKESPYVLLLDKGFTLSSDILSLTTACKMDLYKFPFDTQSCNITFQSTMYSTEEVNIDILSDQSTIINVSKETFQAQGEWELVNINDTKATITDFIEVDQLIYQIIIKRRPLLYVINILIPVFFFLVLDVCSFFASTSASDKLSFKVTLLLSISVMLLILNDTLPSTADKIPLIGIYCGGIFCLIGISILETIFVNYLMVEAKRSGEKTTATVAECDDGVKDQQNLPDSVKDQNEDQSCILTCLQQILIKCRAATDQTQRQKTSLYLTRIARIIDKIFLVLYIIAIIVFMSVLWKLWIA